MKYTLIWVDTWAAGSHSHSITRVSRIVKPENMSLSDSIELYLHDRNAVVFIFVGWPQLEGDDKDIEESEKLHTRGNHESSS